MCLLTFAFHTYQSTSTIKVTEINHQPAFLFYNEGKLVSCEVFDISPLAKEYNDDDDDSEYQFTDQEIKEFEERSAKWKKGESKAYSWKDAKEIITGQKKME